MRQSRAKKQDSTQSKKETSSAKAEAGGSSKPMCPLIKEPCIEHSCAFWRGVYQPGGVGYGCVYLFGSEPVARLTR